MNYFSTLSFILLYALFYIGTVAVVHVIMDDLIVSRFIDGKWTMKEATRYEILVLGVAHIILICIALLIGFFTF